MIATQSVTDQILEEAARRPGCLLDELVLACPDFTWNQVFVEVDRLSRRGEVILTMRSPGVYTVHLPR
jgi:hypothetical protein